MARVPTIAEEDAKRPNRERECLVGERTRIVNRMKATAPRRRICAATSSVGLSPSNSPSSKPPMSAGPMEASDVDCAAKALQGGLLKCLG